MGTVRLHGPLRKLAGGGDHELQGATVADLLRALEREQPAVAGWILDERGRVRRHLNVFVAGEYASADTPVGHGDRVDVLQSISGGA
ncbi:MAG: MoaD/ThiS family protein [Solirubrobacteraceae bacterium]